MSMMSQQHMRNKTPCQFCKSNDNLHGKCLDCDLLLCMSCCESLHSTTQHGTDHRIMKLNDLFETDVTNIRLIPTKCTVHENDCCLFCNTCEVLVCPRCIPVSHKSHKLNEIHAEIEEHVSRYSNRWEHVRKSLESMTIPLKEEQKRRKLNFTRTKEAMENYEKHLHEAVTCMIGNGLKQLQTVYEQDSERMAIEGNKLERGIKKLEDSKTAIDCALKDGDASKVVESINECDISNALDNYPNFANHFRKRIGFIPGKIDSIISTKISGSLMEVWVTKSILLPQTLEMQCVIISNNAESVWIGYGQGITQIALSDGLKIVRIIENLPCKSLLLANFDELLVASGNQIKRLSNFERIRKVCDFPPYEIETMCFTKDSDIIVALVHPQSTTVYNTKKCPQKIVVLGNNGKTKQEYSFDNRNIPILSFPNCTCIAELLDGSICFIERSVGNLQSRVKCLDRSGVIKWEYSGSRSFELKETFLVYSFVTTSFGNIVVTDVLNNALHVLSPYGICLTVINLSELGIKFPTVSMIDTNGQLWIGETGQEFKEITLHTLRLFGF